MFLQKKQNISILSFVAACLLFFGCHKGNETRFADVKVHVNDFTISQEEFPNSKSDIEDYNAVKAVTLAFYDEDNTEVYMSTQLRDDASTYTTFGEFSTSLPMGNYTMVVIGRGHYAGDVLELTSPTSAVYTDRVRETFIATQAVNITNTTGETLSATLHRVVSKVVVVSTDGKTENANNVSVTFAAGGKGVNPTTGLALTNTGFVNTVGISAAVGETSTSNSFLFLATDEQTMTVTLDVLNADGNSISHKVVENVPLRRNRITTLTGSLYSSDATSDFQVETDWLDGNTIGF